MDGFKCNEVMGAMYAFPRVFIPKKAQEEAKVWTLCTICRVLSGHQLLNYCLFLTWHIFSSIIFFTIMYMYFPKIFLTLFLLNRTDQDPVQVIQPIMYNFTKLTVVRCMKTSCLSKYTVLWPTNARAFNSGFYLCSEATIRLSLLPLDELLSSIHVVMQRG